MSKTPNPTEGKLTEAEIREALEHWESGGEGIPMQQLCDMALESLKAPAVTEGCDCTPMQALNGHIACKVFGKPKAPAVTTGERPTCDFREMLNPAPAPLSSEAVGKVREALLDVKRRCYRPEAPSAPVDFKLVDEALALLTPAPSEKCGWCDGRGFNYERYEPHDITRCSKCSGTGHTKAPSPSEKTVHREVVHKKDCKALQYEDGDDCTCHALSGTGHAKKGVKS